MSTKAKISRVLVGVVAGASVGAMVIGFLGASATAETPSDIVAPIIFHSADEMSGIFGADVEEFQYPLPPSVGWPAEVPGFLSQAGVRNEEDLSAITLAFYWQCAWEEAALQAFAKEDIPAATKALDMLSNFESIDVVKKRWIDPNRDWYNSVVVPAYDGKLTGLETAYANGCDVLSRYRPEPASTSVW